MPIFVSRFSAERIAASGLQRARTQRQPESRATTQRNRVDRLDESERERAAQRSERAQDQLPVTTQTAESIREGIQSRQSGSGQGSEASAGQQADQGAARPTFPLQATLPGVPTVSSSAERSSTSQVGRLDENRQATQSQVSTSRFSNLRVSQQTTPGSTRSAEVRQSFRDIPSSASSFSGVLAQRLNAQVDASIRLQRSGETTSGQAAAVGDDRSGLPTPAALEATETPLPATEVRANRPAVEAAQPAAVQQAPNAEQISRANTTPEIQSNLRQDASVIQQGLQADAEVEQRQNQRQTERAAEQSAEARRESTADANESQVRELSVQERQLEQSLRATEREIRSLRNENNRLESSAAAPSTSTVANLANGTTLTV